MKFVQREGGIVFVEIGDVARGLTTADEIGSVNIERYRRGKRTGLVGHLVGGLF